MGTSRRHGLCYGVSTGGQGLGSHYAYMWAISDFVPILSIGSHIFLASHGEHLLNAIVSPRTRDPWRGPATHIEHCVRSIYSPGEAVSLATLAVPHSAMSVGAAWSRMTTSVWWPCGNPVVELRYAMCWIEG